MGEDNEAASGGDISLKKGSELFELVRQFSRINRSVYGLFIVQAAWVAFVSLLVKSLPQTEHPGCLTFTMPGGRALWLREGDAWLYGALVWLVLWIWYSRWWIYLQLVAGRLIRVLVRVLYVLVVVMVLTAALLALPVMALVAMWQVMTFPGWRRAHPDQEARTRGQDDFQPDTLGTAALSRILPSLQDPAKAEGTRREVSRTYGDALLKDMVSWDGLDADARRRLRDAVGTIEAERVVTKELERIRAEGGPNPLGPFIDVVVWLKARVQPLHSSARIGIAPMRSFNYTEDVMAAKAPTQIFAAALGRLKWDLSASRLMALVAMVGLPEHYIPDNFTEAAALRWLLGLDVLLWGSFVGEDGKGIWLNFDRSALYRVTQEDWPSRLFPHRVLLAHPPVVIKYQDIWDTYLTLMLALLHVLQERDRPPGRDDRPWARTDGGALARLWRLVDQLQDSGSEVDTLCRHLAFGVFENLPDARFASPNPLLPRPTDLLVELVGQWIGRQVDEARRGDRWKVPPAELLRLSQRCHQLAPHAPEHAYRMAVLCLVLGRASAARAALAAGREQLQVLDPGERHLAYGRAYVSLLETQHGSRAVNLAIFAVYVAQALQLGDDRTRQSLLKDWQTSVTGQLAAFSDATPVVDVINGLLRVT